MKKYSVREENGNITVLRAADHQSAAESWPFARLSQREILTIWSGPQELEVCELNESFELDVRPCPLERYVFRFDIDRDIDTLKLKGVATKVEGMPFTKALELIMQGKTCRRFDGKRHSLRLRDGRLTMYNHEGAKWGWSAMQEDLLATDWVLVE